MAIVRTNYRRLFLAAGLILLGFGALIGSYYLAQQRVDPRSNANDAPLTVSFMETALRAGATGTETSVMIMINSVNPVSAAAVSIEIPSTILTFDIIKTQNQLENAIESCNVLDQSIAVSTKENASIIKIAKGSSQGNESLPSGNFCFAQIFFTVNTTDIPSSTAINFVTDTTNLEYWEVVTQIDGVAQNEIPELGSSLQVVSESSITPTSTNSPTTIPTTISTINPSPTMTIIPPTTIPTIVISATPTQITTPTVTQEPSPTITQTPASTITPTIYNTPFEPVTPTDGNNCSRLSEGDLDCNGIINLGDFIVFKIEYNAFDAGTLDMSKAKANLEEDDKIDLMDFLVFKIGYLKDNPI